MSAIEWTEKTWNPIAGCSVTSAGCKNCYAMSMAARLEAMTVKTGVADHYLGLTKKVNGKAVWTGEIGIAPDRVWEQPLRRRKPTTYFVNSMGDLFHPNVPEDAISRVFAVMALAPQHRFQVLTKYPERMRDWMRGHSDETWMDLSAADFFWNIRDLPYFCENEANAEWLERHLSDGSDPDALCCKPFPWPNVWLGVSVEDQPRADERIPFLLDTPAAIRFISAEPLLGPVDLTAIRQTEGSFVWNYDTLAGGHYWIDEAGVDHSTDGPRFAQLDWVIVGGESGSGARPMHPDWARSLRDQCAAADVPFFFKQWGAWLPWEPADAPFFSSQTGGYVDGHVAAWNDAEGEGLYDDLQCKNWDVDYGNHDFARLCLFERVGKKAAGRALDGAIHDGMPLDWAA